MVRLSWMVLPDISPKLLTTNIQASTGSGGLLLRSLPWLSAGGLGSFPHSPVHMVACNNSILPSPEQEND